MTLNANHRPLKVVYLLALLGLIFALWSTPLITPLKILVVFFHEASHALTAVITGGTVIEMTLDQHQGGRVVAAGDMRLLTLSAGYLGSVVWGGLIFFVAARTEKDRLVSGALGLIMLAIAVYFIRNLYGLGFTLIVGGAMLALAKRGSATLNDIVLRLIGLTSMCYAPLDIWSDTIARSQLRSDARMLAEEFGGTTMLWGGIWIAVSALAIVWVIRKSLTSSPANSRTGD